MALMYCRECGKQVSSEARTCPNCGIAWPVLTEENLVLARREADHTAIQSHGVGRHSFSPGIAALLSLFLPGAGQVYKGHVGRGLLWFVAVALGYLMLVFPGVVLHLLCIFSAARR